MATVVSITNPITGAVEQVDKLDHTAQQIDDAVALAPQLSNPNLLDNPNFAVNQRGNTSAPGSPTVYIVDRWKTYGYSSSTVSVLENGHISMNGGNASAGSSLLHIFEKTLPAGTYTLSVKVAACENPTSGGNYGILYARKGTTAVGNAVYIKGPGITSKTFTVADGEVDGISIGCVNTSTIEFECAKLELGSQQTLAHQDSDGNWVLNEIPDYGEQLRRCQRYFWRSWTGERNLQNSILGVVFGISGGNNRITGLDYPVEMRTRPSITVYGLTGANKVTFWDNDDDYGPVSPAYWDTQRCTVLHCDGAGLSNNDRVYYFIEANADL